VRRGLSRWSLQHEIMLAASASGCISTPEAIALRVRLDTREPKIFNRPATLQHSNDGTVVSIAKDHPLRRRASSQRAVARRALCQLTRRGLLERTGRGQYRITHQGAAVVAEYPDDRAKFGNRLDKRKPRARKASVVSHL
jgi:restriction endonuclease Mrr